MKEESPPPASALMLLDEAGDVVSKLLASLEPSDIVLDVKDLEHVDEVLIEVTVVDVEMVIVDVVEMDAMNRMIAAVVIGGIALAMSIVKSRSGGGRSSD